MSTQTTFSHHHSSIHAPPPPDAISPLSPDLTVEVLSLLPVKSLLQFKCVCHSWNSLISSSGFAKYHLRRSSTGPPHHHHRLLAQVSSPNDDDSSGDVYTLSHPLRSLIDDPSSSSSPPLSFVLARGAKIVGSCNGLICWVRTANSPGNPPDFHYLNPSTGLKSTAPRFRHPPERFTMFGFGYDSLSDSYKTVAIYRDKIVEKSAVHVYTLGGGGGDGEGSWRMLRQSLPLLPLPLRSDTFAKDCGGRFVNGTLNWLAFRPDGTPLVFNVDIGNETCGEVSLPAEVDKSTVFSSPNLWVLGGCLCFSFEMRNSEFVLWQMKEYGVADSWTLLLDISHEEVGIMYRHQFFPRPIFVLDNGEVLLRINNSGMFVLYNPRLESFKYLQFQSDKIWFQGSTHIESLVSPCMPVAN